MSGPITVSCSARLDEANTAAQIQVYENGNWANRGTPNVTHSTGVGTAPVSIDWQDTTDLKGGCWDYRVQGTHFGQHGNIFALPTYNSPPRRICR